MDVMRPVIIIMVIVIIIIICLLHVDSQADEADSTPPVVDPFSTQTGNLP